MACCGNSPLEKLQVGCGAVPAKRLGENHYSADRAKRMGMEGRKAALISQIPQAFRPPGVEVLWISGLGFSGTSVAPSGQMPTNEGLCLAQRQPGPTCTSGSGGRGKGGGQRSSCPTPLLKAAKDLLSQQADETSHNLAWDKSRKSLQTHSLETEAAGTPTRRRPEGGRHRQEVRTLAKKCCEGPVVFPWSHVLLASDPSSWFFPLLQIKTEPAQHGGPASSQPSRTLVRKPFQLWDPLFRMTACLGPTRSDALIRLFPGPTWKR